jgi:phage portal protein BeeE
MRIFDLLKQASGPALGTPEGVLSLGVVSPFQAQPQLPPALVAKDLGLGPGPLTRIDAMKVPGVAKGRALLHSLIGSRPLRAYRGNVALAPEAQPTWLYRSDSGISPVLRTKSILDDLIFCEASLLAVKRGDSEGAPILDAAHVPYDRWSVNQNGEILVDNIPAPEGTVIWIPGPGPGLLNSAADDIAAARDITSAYRRRVRNPLPAMVLQEQVEGTMTQSEVEDYVQAVAEARRNEDNAVMFVDGRMRLEAHAGSETDLFETGRNASRIDIANHLNLPVALLDGSVSAASLTYSTQEGQRNELVDFTLPYWIDPIQEALSLDDVVPRGQRIRFDFTDLIAPTASPTGPNTED